MPVPDKLHSHSHSHSRSDSADSLNSAAGPPSKRSSPTLISRSSAAHQQQHSLSNGTARPPLRNTFDLEPNPFEQSFRNSSSSSFPNIRGDNHGPASPSSADKRSPTSSNSSHSRKASLNNVPTSAAHGETPKPILPPLASITSPSDPSYAWSFSAAGLTNSLRSGPLSPAMLAGPQTQPPASIPQPAASIAALASSAAAVHPPLFAFDPSGSFRTGLTPSTGLTPLVGGPVAFPPPSPNTAAFLAMVNQGANVGAAPTITPNTLNAITGVLNQHTAIQQQQQQQAQQQQQQQQQASAQAQSDPTSITNGNGNANVSQGQSGQPAAAVNNVSSAYSSNGSAAQRSYQQNAQNTSNHAANGLFLLSQAHQELTKREEAQKQSMAQASANGDNGNTNGQVANSSQDESASTKRGSKRKTDTASVSSATSAATKPAGSKRTRTASSAATNTRAAAARRGSTTASLEDDEDDMDSEDEVAAMASAGTTTSKGSKKPETEEEKRRNFLERNRQAALKCRQRKKAWLAQLQARVEFLQNENERLTSALVSSREEISRLSQLVGSAGVSLPLAAGVGVPLAGIGIGAIQQQQQQAPYMAQTHHPVSVPVSLAQGGQAGSPPMQNKVSPQQQHQSPHSPTSEGRSSRSSFRGEYASVRDAPNARDYAREVKREMNGPMHGHAPQAVTVNGRGYGY